MKNNPIVINGVPFGNYADAISYLQRQKEKEDFIQKEQVMDAMTIIRKIETKHEAVLLVCLAPEQNKEEYLQATISKYFGPQYTFEHNVPVKKYVVSKEASEIEKSTKRYLLRVLEENAANFSSNNVLALENVRIAGQNYQHFVIADYRPNTCKPECPVTIKELLRDIAPYLSSFTTVVPVKEENYS